VTGTKSRCFAALLWLFACAKPTPTDHAAPRWKESAAVPRNLALHVRIAGQGPPNILLLHGLAGSGRYFGSAFDDLAKDGRVIAPDLLGFGQSPRPTAVPYDAAHHSRAIWKVLDELGVQGPIYIAGHSIGALLALRVAADRPERVLGIVAFNPPIYSSPASARAHLNQLGLVSRLLFLDSGPAHVLCILVCSFRRPAAWIATWIRPELPAAIARDGVRHTWESYSGTLRNVLLKPQPPGALAGFERPLWLIAGEKDEIVDLAFLSELTRRESIRLEIWRGAHDLPLTDPERCVAAIRRLINHHRIEPSGPTPASS